MTRLAFGIGSCGAWTPGRERWQDWCAWAGVELPASIDEAATPPVLLRRRIGALGQRALKVAWGMPQLADAVYVFASRHGEFDRTTALLRAVANREQASPAEFSLSVHNALTGLLSIATRNRRDHTTVTAGVESFCLGLLEAATRVVEAPGTPALLVYYDAPLPAPYDELLVGLPSAREPLVVTLLIVPPGDGQWNIELSLEPGGDTIEPEPALRFLKFLLAGHGSERSSGQRSAWSWRHV